MHSQQEERLSFELRYYVRILGQNDKLRSFENREAIEKSPGAICWAFLNDQFQPVEVDRP